MIAALGVMAVTLPFSSASAQIEPRTPTGSMIRQAPKRVSAEEAGRIRAAFGRCVVARSPTQTERFLSASDPVEFDPAGAGVDPNAFTKTFAMDQCLGEVADADASTMRMSSAAFRTMLLEQAYLRARTSAPPDDAPLAPERHYVSQGSNIPRAQALGRFADCVVARQPVEADALLRTSSGSTAELAAARALAPSLGACLAAGQQLTFNPENIRAFAADGLWQRYVATRTASPVQQ